MAERSLTFGPFRLDLFQNRLWRQEQPIALRPQSLAVLRYLVLHADRLVTKAELRQHVWGGPHVTDYGAAGVCARDSRGVRRYGGGAAVSRNGRPAGVSVSAGAGRHAPAAADGGPRRGPPGGSRVAARALAVGQGGPAPVRLPQWRSRDRQDDGGRPVCWPACPRRPRWASGGASASSTMARGNRTCPSWRRWGSSAQAPQREALRRVLRRYAPLWLVQLPGLLSEAELERLQRQLQGATPARMLRELAEALDVLTADHPAGAGARRPAVE